MKPDYVLSLEEELDNAQLELEKFQRIVYPDISNLKPWRIIHEQDDKNRSIMLNYGWENTRITSILRYSDVGVCTYVSCKAQRNKQSATVIITGAFNRDMSRKILRSNIRRALVALYC